MTEAQTFISREMRWLMQSIAVRWRKEFDDVELKGIDLTPPEVNKKSDCKYQKLVSHFNLDTNQRLILALALAPFFVPQDLLSVTSESTTYRPSAFGARSANNSTLFIPTGTMALFLIAGSYPEKRISAFIELTEHPMFKKNMIIVSVESHHEPLGSGFLKPEEKLYHYLLGKISIEQLDTLEK